MSHFCLLRDPAGYQSIPWNLVSDDGVLEYWLEHLEKLSEKVFGYARDHYGRGAKDRIDRTREDLAEELASIRVNRMIDGNDKPTPIDFDRMWQGLLCRHGLVDPFASIKRKANNDACIMYPNVVRRLHAMADKDKWFSLIEGTLAGNLFDLGGESTMNLSDSPDGFFDSLENLKPRPWFVDDCDMLVEDMLLAPPAKWSKVVIFIDNAGADFVLGVMPLARELALAGSQIILAANEKPALNDMTVDETIDVVEKLSLGDADLHALIEAGMFEVVSTGNDIPMIDLGNVSDELNEAASDADLVILEGMGRAVESNFDVQFSVDSIQLAMIKDPAVGKKIGAESFDCVCKYVPLVVTP